MRNPKGKTHTNKRVKYDICNKLLIRETLPLILANLEVNSYQCPQHIKMWSMVGSMNISARLSQYIASKCSYAHVIYGTEPS